MGLATPEEKRRILESLKNSDKKYRKPFEKGDLAAVSFLGGTWNDYAQIVFNMMIADSLLNIEDQLRELNWRLANPTPPQ